MSVSNITTVPSELLPIENVALRNEDEIAPCSTYDKFVSWAGEKPKYLVEAAVNALQYIELWNALAPTRSISTPIDHWKLNKAGRPFFGAVDGLKGIVEIVKKTGERSFKNLTEVVTSVGYTISDSVDLVRVLQFTKVVQLSARVDNLFSAIKNAAALCGLVPDVIKGTHAIEKLSKVDPNNLPGVAEEKKPLAKQIKAEWIKTETNRVWWERVKNGSGAVLCTLGLLSLVQNVHLLIWAIGSTISLSGKVNMHFDKMNTQYWEKRMVQVLNSQRG